MADNSEIMKILLSRTEGQGKPQAQTSQGPTSAPPQQAYGDQMQKAGLIQGAQSLNKGLNTGQTTESPIKSMGNFEAMGGGATGAINKMTPDAPFKTGLSAPTWSPPAMTPSPMDDMAPKPAARVPPDWKRFDTAQKMITGYQNNWQPNPMLIRLLEGSVG